MVIIKKVNLLFIGSVRTTNIVSFLNASVVAVQKRSITGRAHFEMSKNKKYGSK